MCTCSKHVANLHWILLFCRGVSDEVSMNGILISLCKHSSCRALSIYLLSEAHRIILMSILGSAFILLSNLTASVIRSVFLFRKMLNICPVSSPMNSALNLFPLVFLYLIELISRNIISLFGYGMLPSLKYPFLLINSRLCESIFGSFSTEYYAQNTVHFCFFWKYGRVSTKYSNYLPLFYVHF